ncbi:MAG TPA: GntR family transcriptional regulator [Mycobacteriales bacterium]|nr:GntR family transcriptional regulator [Mycobacteriales bacterium]
MPEARQRKHERIAADLREMIRSGELRDGDRLPGENGLMQSYGVARMTARQALVALQNEGLAIARKGSGVYVRTFRPVRRLCSRRLSRDVWGAGRSMWEVDSSTAPVTVDRLIIEKLPATDPVAHLLGIPPGTPIISRRRRYLVDGEPVQLATSYIPADLAKGTPIASPDTGPGGIYARLADIGRAPERFTEELHARMPTAEEMSALELASGTPVISMVRTAFDAADTAVEASDITLSASAYVLQYDFSAQPARPADGIREIK